MKKTISLLLLAGAFCVTACGPSAEEVAKDEAAKQAKLDSIREAESKAAPVMPDSAVSTTDTSIVEEASHH